MRVDISLLPAFAATFMLVFARVGAMVMLLPGFGESNIPVRIKLAIALLLTLIILPLHRAAYQVDLTSMTSLGVLMVHEIVIGVVAGEDEATLPWRDREVARRRRTPRHRAEYAGQCDRRHREERSRDPASATSA